MRFRRCPATVTGDERRTRRQVAVGPKPLADDAGKARREDDPGARRPGTVINLRGRVTVVEPRTGSGNRRSRPHDQTSPHQRKESKVRIAFISLILTALMLVPASQIAAQQQSEKEKERVLTKRIVVSARRLSDESQSAEKVPANVTVITREEIEESGARTLQELLADYSGIIFYDNVGNGVETTIDIRGFSEGTSMAVYVDGVRINEPDDNGVNLELLDPAVIERIEIIPGGASFSHGNGALSGTVKIYTRRGYGEPFSELSAGYGGFSTQRAGIRSGSTMGPHSYFLSYGYLDSEGFRDNSKVRQHKLFGKYDYEVPGSYGLELSFRYSSGELGNPGALTPDELIQDREQSPFNLVDFNKTDENVVTARFSYNLSEKTLLSVVGHRREADIEVLTTGRNAALWGGFRSASKNESMGIAGQLTYQNDLDNWGHSLTAGLEIVRDKFGNTGFYTDINGDPTSDANDRDTDQDSKAFYFHASLDPTDFLTFTSAVRHDRVNMDFIDNFSNETGGKEFSNTTAMAGINLVPARGTALFFRYSQSFQTPTVNDLFAFPFFGSNPDLEPTTGDTYEGGFRAALGESWNLQAALYRMDLENEVVFVITDPIWFIGSNENVGKSRRIGFEMQLDGKLAEVFKLLATYSYTKAENLSLSDDLGVDNLRIPLVPNHKFALLAGFDFGAWRLGGELLYVGEQVLSGDDTNSGPLLDPYTVANLRASFDMGAWTLRLDLLNTLDEEYETRGIYSSGAIYFTPAPGRQFMATLELKY